MKWLRWYRGTAERAKFRVIASLASNPSMGGGSVHNDRVDGAVFHTDVLAVWIALLEDAGNASHWGYVTRDARYIATLLELGMQEVEAVLSSMVDEEMIELCDSECGKNRFHIKNWDKYQFVSDTDPTAGDRQKRYREKHKSNALKTRTDTDTDTDTERKKEKNGSTPQKYAFESGIIRLNKKDLSQWKAAFTNLNLEAELIACAPWAAQQKSWFNAVSTLLGKKNREQATALERARIAPEKRSGTGII